MALLPRSFVSRGIFRADLEGHCIFANQRWSELTGYPLHAALGADWGESGSSGRPGAARNRVGESCPDRGAIARGAIANLRPNGEIVWVQTEAASKSAMRGAVDRIFGDSGRYHGAPEIREALQRSHDKLDENPGAHGKDRAHRQHRRLRPRNAIISTDLEGRIVSWNKAAEANLWIHGKGGAWQADLPHHALEQEGRGDDAEGAVRRGERVSEFETVRAARGGGN